MSIGELERRAGIGPSHAARLAYWLLFALLKDRAFAAAVADPKVRIAEKEKTLDRRHKIIVMRDDELDHDAVIGFDPPLRTFLLQTFWGAGFGKSGSAHFWKNSPVWRRSPRRPVERATRLPTCHDERSSR